MHGQLWLVPSQDPRTPMRTMIFRPGGAGPFPLVVVNHGSLESAELREKSSHNLFDAASQWFVQHGYVVALPQRPGHGDTGGSYLESAGPCDRADFRKAGLATADSIQAAIDYLVTQPFVKRAGVIVVGHSAGGLGALALASRNPRNVKAVIAFAAVRGGRINGRANNNCAPERLVEAARNYGARARIPALAVYAGNDSFISAGLSRNFADAYRAAGGRLDYRLLGDFGRDGHWLFEQRDGVAIWGPVVEEFLKGVQ